MHWLDKRVGRRDRGGGAAGILCRRRPGDLRHDGRAQPRRFIEGRPHRSEWAENTYRALEAHEEVLKNAKVDLKETFDNSFVDKAAAAAR